MLNYLKKILDGKQNKFYLFIKCSDELEIGNKGCFRRIEIIGAFSLCLDFVNLFLNILELNRKSKD